MSAQAKLAWPPTKEDLQRLYVDQKLSAAKIAKAYGLKTGNPRSAAFLVTYHLKRHRIDRRDRIEELRKETAAIVQAWKANHPEIDWGQANHPEEVQLGGRVDGGVRVTAEENAVIELLRTPNLSIEHLDPDTKGRVGSAIQELHIRRGVSLTDIANLIGNKTSGYASWVARQVGVQPRAFEEGRLKGIHEKVRKYERKPFDGTDDDRAYLLGLKHGDLYAYTPFGDAVRVSTSTTHPALADLFTRLFSPYGHVYKHPRFKEDTRTYEWNLQTILDRSFDFLLDSRDKCRDWIVKKEDTMLAYLAGLIDAEGNIRIYANPRTVGLIVGIYNTDIDLLEFAYTCLERLGCRPLRPYLSKESGYISPGFHILMKRDYWRVFVARFDEAHSLLRRLPLRHKEKVEMREVAISLEKGDLYGGVADKISLLKKSFDEETHGFTKQAELDFHAQHPARAS